MILVVGFGIDGDELSGRTPQECFVAGVELMSTMQAARCEPAGHVHVHSWNAKRCLAAARLSRPAATCRMVHDDWSSITWEDQ